MKRKFLDFTKVHYQTRRDGHAPEMRTRHNRGAQFKTGGGDEDEGEDEEDGEDSKDTPEVKKQKKELLLKVKETVKQTVADLKLQNGDDVQKAFTTMLGTASVEALQSFIGTDKAAMEQSIKKMAGAIQKLTKLVESGGASAQQQTNLSIIKQMLNDEKVLAAIQTAMGRQGMGKEVVLDTHEALKLRQQAAVGMDTTNVVDDTTIPDDILHSFSVDGFVKKRRPKEYLFEIANRRTVEEIKEYKTWLEEGDEQGAFAIVSEGAVKPLVSKTLIRNKSKYKKVAGKRVYTEEFTKFRKEAYTILEDLFNDQLMRNYATIVTTSLLTAAASYVGTALDGYYDNPTDYHAIGAVAAQIETLEFNPDLLIINPQDKWRIGLQQDNNGQFFITIPQMSPSGQVTMMGFRVFTTSRMEVGNFILGESGLYKVEDEPVTVRMGYGIDVTKDGDGKVTDVKSDFDSNRFRIIAEFYFHSYIATVNTGSFVKANFADMKALLKKEAV